MCATTPVGRQERRYTRQSYVFLTLDESFGSNGEMSTTGEPGQRTGEPGKNRERHVRWATTGHSQPLPAMEANVFIFVELPAVVITLSHRATPVASAYAFRRAWLLVSPAMRSRQPDNCVESLRPFTLYAYIIFRNFGGLDSARYRVELN